VRVAAANRGVAVLVGGRFAAAPGLAASVGADGAALDLADALAFARAHQPA
jgi:hypothetical protein